MNSTSMKLPIVGAIVGGVLANIFVLFPFVQNPGMLSIVAGPAYAILLILGIIITPDLFANSLGQSLFSTARLLLIPAAIISWFVAGIILSAHKNTKQTIIFVVYLGIWILSAAAMTILFAAAGG